MPLHIPAPLRASPALSTAAPALQDGQRLLVLVCGGGACTLAQLQAWHPHLPSTP